ncbi:hypothetical protein PAPHI01_2035 [Pancytospora philotis]|nr:hypothetical protein PAPHI01_2035 [Pancytospora philotis]
MRRVGLSLDDPKPVMKQKIADYFHSKPKFRPPSKSLTRAAEVSLCKGPDITKLALNGRANAGRRFLIKCRLGTIITRNDLVRMNRIPGGQLGICLGCGEACDKSPEHILLDCPRHDEPRTALLSTVIASIRTLCPEGGGDNC